MKSDSKCSGGLESEDCNFESNVWKDCISSPERSTTSSTATSKHSSELFIYDLCRMEYFRNWQEQFRAGNRNDNLQNIPMPDSQTVLQESQHPHSLSNEEFMVLMNTPPPTLFNPPARGPPMNDITSRSQQGIQEPLFSNPNLFSQYSQCHVPDSLAAIGRVPIVSDSQPPPPAPQNQPASFHVDAPPAEDAAATRAAPPMQVDAPPAEETTSKKRTTTKKATKKAKKTKTKAADNAASDDEEGNSLRWIDAEVTQLIAFRNEMDDEFRANAKKQGVNVWDKLQGRMIATCDNFSKSAAACRKKWNALYTQYKVDKRLLQVSGEERKITCRFFEDIDQGFNNLANVRKVVHGDADGSPNPFPPDLNVPIEGQGSGGNGTPDPVTNPTTDPSRPSATTPASTNMTRKTNGEHISSLMSGMVTQTKEMVSQTSVMITQTTNMATDIHDNTEVLRGLRFDLARLIDKL